MNTEGDVAALGKTTSSDSSIGQEMCSESAGIDEFDSAVACSVFGSAGLEPVFAWHPDPYGLSVLADWTGGAWDGHYPDPVGSNLPGHPG